MCISVLWSYMTCVDDNHIFVRIVLIWVCLCSSLCLGLGSPYTALQVSAFERVGLRPNGSSAETVIQDFITRGFTVDDLFTILKTMGHLEGMKILWNHGEDRAVPSVSRVWS